MSHTLASQGQDLLLALGDSRQGNVANIQGTQWGLDAAYVGPGKRLPQI